MVHVVVESCSPLDFSEDRKVSSLGVLCSAMTYQSHIVDAQLPVLTFLIVQSTKLAGLFLLGQLLCSVIRLLVTGVCQRDNYISAPDVKH